MFVETFQMVLVHLFLLLSLYVLTNTSYLILPSSMLDICSTEMNSFLIILLYASTFPCNCGKEFGIGLSFMLLCSRKCLKILDVNGLPLSCMILVGFFV